MSDNRAPGDGQAAAPDGSGSHHGTRRDAGSGHSGARPSRRLFLAGAAVGSATVVSAGGAWLLRTDRAQRQTPDTGEPTFQVPPRAPASTAPRKAAGWPVAIAESSAPPAYGRGTLYCAEHGGRVRAVDSVTGRERWRFDAPVPGAAHDEVSQETPVLGDGSVVISRSGPGAAIFALDASDGSPRWSRPVDGEVSFARGRDVLIVERGASAEPPVLTPDRVCAVRAATGRTVWSVEETGVNQVLRTAGAVVVQHLVRQPDDSWDERIRALDPDTGRTLWRGEVETVGSAGVRWADGLLLAVAAPYEGPQRLTALRASDGRLRWTASFGEVNADVVFGPHGTLFVEADGRFLSLEARSGRTLWSRRRRGTSIAHRPLAHGTTVFTLEGLGSTDTSGLEPAQVRMLFLDARSGALRRSLVWKGEHAAPVAASDDTVFATLNRADQTVLLAVDITSGEQLWSRPSGGGYTYALREGSLYVHGEGIHRLDSRTGASTAD